MHRRDYFHPVVEIAGHPVGRTHEYQFIAPIGEDKDTGVLQIAVDNAANLHIIGQTCLLRHQRTIASHQQIHLHPASSRLVQTAHHLLVGNMVHFHLDISRLTRFLVLYLVLNQLFELVAHPVGRYQEFLETRLGIGSLDEIENRGNILGDTLGRRHQDAVGISPGIAFVEIPRADASDIRAVLHADMQDLGMNLQAFDPENHLDAGFLHLLGPFYVGNLIETGQQLDDHRHLLAVAGRPDQRLHHFRLAGQTVERNLDALDPGADSGFLQDTDKGIETMVRHMQEPVLFQNLVQNTVRTVQFRLEQGRPGRILEVFPTAIGKRHQVLMVLVPTAAQNGIQLVQVHQTEHPLLEILGHRGIIDHPQRLPSLPALQALGNLLQYPVPRVVVYLHLGIAGKLEGIGFELFVTQTGKHQRQAATQHIVHIHQIALAVLVGQAHKAAANLDRHFEKRIVLLGFLIPAPHFDGQVDAFIGLVA